MAGEQLRATRKEGGRRRPSTGFPILALPDAARSLEEVARYGTEFPRAAFAQHLGHETANSGAFKQRLAAFRDWHMVSTSRDHVILTELGKRIAMPLDETSKCEALVEAFMSCEVFKRAYESSAKGQSLNVSNIANNAVHSFGVGATSRDAFARSFMQSVVAAGLAEVDGDGKIRLLPEEQHKAEDRVAIGSGPLGTGSGQLHIPAASPSDSPTILRQVYPVVGGSVQFEVQLNRPLPVEAYSALAELARTAKELADVLVGQVDIDALQVVDGQAIGATGMSR